ncbi:MAG: Ser-Thr-rich GPI-anchored membrane family protein [Promethearchaeota archaeon]
MNYITYKKTKKIFLIFCISILIAIPFVNTAFPLKNYDSGDKENIIPSNTFITTVHGKKYLAEYITREKIEEMRRQSELIVPNRESNHIIDGHGTGYMPLSAEELESLIGKVSLIDVIPESGSPKFGDSADISTEIYFPVVGDQGGQGSCTAWANAYYAYGYMEAKDYGWDASSGNTDYLLSPAWVYNKVAAIDYGSAPVEVAQLMIDWGVSTLTTMPYNDADVDSWGDEPAWREAPYHRPLSYTPIIFTGPTTIDTIKGLLDSGVPVTFAIDANQFYGGGFADNWILSSSEYAYAPYSLNHAQCFVGYDDAITDDGDVGAFRVVNSWGSGWGDSGYYWVTYDAFSEFAVDPYQAILYYDDRIDYNPSLISTWEFSATPTRMDDIITLGVGLHESPFDTIIPLYDGDGVNLFPDFMALDISEFQSYYDADPDVYFFLEIGSSTTTGTISSFLIERYIGGVLQEISTESPDVPKDTPGYVYGTFMDMDHELSVSLEVPTNPEIFVSYTINATVFNNGLNDEYDVDLFLYLDDVVVNSTTISTLPIGANETISYLWTPSEYKTYNFTAYAPPVPGEASVSNNICTELMYILTQIFFDDFESGLSQWDSITGLWHLTDTGSSWPDPCHSPTHSMWFGQEATGDYDTGYQEMGDITTIPIDLSASDAATLEFYHWREGEGGGYDVSYVYISTDGVNWDLLYQSSSSYIAPWQHVSLDISAYTGHSSVQIMFFFDTLDEVYNDYRGWLVDDIEILATGISNPHDLRVDLEVPDDPELYNPYTINATVTNIGENTESDVELFLYLDESEVNSTIISTLPVGASEIVTYEWTPLDYGNYNFTAYAPPVLDETIIENNIITEILYITYGNVILFDEAHLPLYSIGSNPAYETEGAYSEFAGMLTDAGYMVDTIDPGTVIDTTVLSVCDILVIVASQNAYTTAELDAIEAWVTAGGSLLLISEWYTLGTDMDPLAARFGFDFKNDAISDSDDGVGTGSSIQLFYDGPNINSHPITDGVSRVEMYAGDGLIAAPGDEIPIIQTDTDGTATWYYEGTPALGVSVMSVLDGGSAGAGKVCVIGDSNIWDSAYDVDSDGDLDFYDSDNEILAMNTINWLITIPSLTILFDEAHSPAQSIGGGYSEFAGMLTDAGYIVDTIDVGTVIDTTVLSVCDILVIACSSDAYTTAELDAIETWVQNGGSLLLITDYGSFGTIMDTIAARFGFDFKNDGILDSDDDVGGGGTGQNCYDGPNILSHPITTGVSRVEMYAGDGLSVGPVDEIPIIITDTDGTATWVYEGTPALGVSLMSVVDDGSAGAGKVCVIGDSNIWDSSADSESDGEVNFYDSDNEILAMNTINWLAQALLDSITVLSPDSLSSWETGTSEEITWNSTGSISDVKIELYKDGVFELEIVASTTNDGSYTWTIPALEDGIDYQIKISDMSNPDIYDFSEDFEIYTPDSITVLSPDSLSSWETGTSEEITWNSTGSISDVKIELYKDGVFELEIVASTTNDGSYTWTIPALEDGIDYQIKISDVSNPDTHDFSEEFEIYTPDSITVLSPDIFCSWETGTSEEITWTSTGSISDVKIELYKMGEFVLEIVASTSNDGSYTWAIPTDLEDGIDYQIKISDVSNPDTYDFSEYFEIYTLDSITVTNPDSLSSWETGMPEEITWTSTGSISDVKIELYKDGVSILEIVASTTNDGSYTWTIPTDLEDGTDYQIKISDVSNPDTYDFSEDFEIYTSDSITVTHPGGILAWEMGTSQEINWISTGTISDVKIELYKDGVFVLEIVASTTNDGSYTWAIPTDLEDGIDYQIKISDVANPDTYDISPNFALTSEDIPGDGEIIPSYNLYILIGLICAVSVILIKKRFKIIK